MLTPFGRWVRAFRKERKITLREMARTIGKTPSYLSAIELGRKSVPDSIFEVLDEFYDLTGEMRHELRSTIGDSKIAAAVKFDRHLDADDRHLATMFARTFEKLPNDKKSELLKWMEKLDE